MKHRLSKNKIFNVHLSSIGPESVQRKDGAEKEISSNKKKVDYGLRKSFCLISTSFRDNKKVLLLFISKRGSSKSHNPSEGIKKYWQLVSSYTIIPMLLLQITLQKSKHNNMQTCCLCEISFREETASICIKQRHQLESVWSQIICPLLPFCRSPYDVRTSPIGARSTKRNNFYDNLKVMTSFCALKLFMPSLWRSGLPFTRHGCCWWKYLR